MASSMLIEAKGARIVYDFGRGISQRLEDISLKQNDIEHIVISHFHPDHYSDLIAYLHAAVYSKVDPRERDLNIYGPEGIADVIEKIIGLIGENDMKDAKFDMHSHEIKKGKYFIDDLEMYFGDMPHQHNKGLKFYLDNKSYACTGDTSFSASNLLIF